MAENAGVEFHDNGDKPEDRSGDAAPGAALAVGYGKPPVRTRFKPGQSGNPTGRPSGRPRKPRSLAHDLIEVLQEPVTLGEGEARETLSRQRSILRALAAKAMAGDPRAMAQIIDLARWTSGFRPSFRVVMPED